MLSQPQFSHSYQDQLMDKFIEKEFEDGDKDKVGDLMSFDYFLKVYKTALVWNRVKFQKRKDELTEKRRKALKEDNMTNYRQIHMDMTSQDEVCLEKVLEDVLEKLEISEDAFTQALNLYLGDPEKQPLAKEAMEDAKVDREEGVLPEDRKEPEITMDKKETIAGQLALQNISIE